MFDLAFVFMIISLLSLIIAFQCESLFERLVFVTNAAAFAQASYCRLLTGLHITPLPSYICALKTYTIAIVFVIVCRHVWTYYKGDNYED